VWFAEYDDDEIYINDNIMAVDSDSQSSEAMPQVNHICNKTNGDLDNDLPAAKNAKLHVPVSGGTVHRQSSANSTAAAAITAGPVNGLRTREHNVILQRLAIVEVKKPGKGNKFEDEKYTGC